MKTKCETNDNGIRYSWLLIEYYATKSEDFLRGMMVMIMRANERETI